ncbi:MAG: UDP-N-acetylglucosamine 2-epimerase (hydrolyzing) [Gemmatimonadaceae bacterium]|nr:UDP-N-acetylglucosamine 2-epimerase (hydrolyzing) [Gemmatimonadaceae bacterium]
MSRAKRRVCVVITARPSYSRIKTALDAIVAHPDLELILVVAASALLERYGMVVKEIERDGFAIAARVRMVIEGEHVGAMAKTTGLGMIELATTFENLNPDIVVTVADRFETMATALTAAYMNIPLAHIQGGEVTGSIDEKVRHSVTKLADLHLVSCEPAADRVRRLGERSRQVFVTGCPSIDLASRIMDDPALDFDPCSKYGGVGPYVDVRQPYIVVLQHPVTTEHRLARRHTDETLAAVLETGIPALWFWPNVDAGSDSTSQALRIFRERHPDAPVHFFKNFAPIDFLKLLYNAQALVGNSSVGVRECGYLGTPVVDIGSRQHGRDKSVNVLAADYTQYSISAALRQQVAAGRYPQDLLYGDGLAGPRIAQALADAPLTVTKFLHFE